MYPPIDYVMTLFDVSVPPIAFSAPNYLIFGFFPSEKQCCFSSFLFFFCTSSYRDKCFSLTFLNYGVQVMLQGPAEKQLP